MALLKNDVKKVLRLHGVVIFHYIGMIQLVHEFYLRQLREQEI